jgi:hypothetical protein
MRKLVVVGLVAIGASLAMAEGAAASGATWSPDTADFGKVPVGLSSAPMTFTLTATAGGYSPKPQITNSTVFDVTGTTCGATLPAGTSCTAQVVFHPWGPAPFDGILEGNGESGSGIAVEANFTGVGVAAPKKKKCKKGFKLVKKHGKTTCKKTKH